jgi:hypothetical protein
LAWCQYGYSSSGRLTSSSRAEPAVGDGDHDQGHEELQPVAASISNALEQDGVKQRTTC